MAKRSHPNSLKNLTHNGRPLAYGEPKKSRRLSVTETGWSSIQSVAVGLGISVSEFLEQVGRGKLAVLNTDMLALIEDALDSALLRQAIAETNDEFTTPEEVLAERGLTTAELNE